MSKPYPTLFIALLLAGCAQLPTFDTRDVDRSLLPTQVSASIKTHRGQLVMWGGSILSGKNLQNTTRLEVLAYPLDSDGWPERDQKPLGRFILEQQGYLETADYAKGRVITVVGRVIGLEHGKVDESAYDFPLIQVRQLHLWQQSDRKSGTRFHFGIGVMIH